MPPLDGVWRPVRAELAGEPAPALVLERTEVELREGRYWVRFGDEVSDRGLYTVETGASPAHLTLRGTNGTNAGRSIPCIYRLAAAELVVCYGLAGERPATFASAADAPHYLVHYRRHAD